MNESDKAGLSVLLPQAHVVVFSDDKKTLKAVEDLRQDWRYARVSVDAHEGGIAEAADIYKNEASPDILILQTDSIEDDLTERLSALADNCDEKTAAIVIGPVNDVYLYRNLIEMGISDYLVKPLAANVLADVVAKTLIERLGVSASRLLAFVGAKGGVGTSAIAQGCAHGISDILHQKMIYLCAAGGWSTLGVGMGFEPSTTLAEAAKAAESNAEDNLQRMIFSVSDKLDVLASGGDPMLERPLSTDQLETLIDVLMIKYPVVLVDLSGADPHHTKAVLSRAHHTYLVTTPLLSALRLSRSLLQEIKGLRGGLDTDIDVLLNKQDKAKTQEVQKVDIEKAMEVKVSCEIKYNPKLFMDAENEGKNLLSTKEGKMIFETALKPLIEKKLLPHPGDLHEEKPKKDGIFKSLFSSNKSEA